MRAAGNNQKTHYVKTKLLLLLRIDPSMKMKAEFFKSHNFSRVASLMLMRLLEKPLTHVEKQ